MFVPLTPPQVPVSPIASIVRPAEKPKAPEPVLYTIKDGDVLEKVASDQHTTVQKLFNKNTAIVDPNVIEVGLELTIPADEEILTDRPLPASQVWNPTSSSLPNNVNSGGFSVSGNTYFAGQCVWYIKNIVPWVQNGWGNGSDWVYKSGHRVSSIPAVGTVAAAIAYNHVALVTGISGQTVHITEMNYKGVGVISERDAPVSEFQYIYP